MVDACDVVISRQHGAELCEEIGLRRDGLSSPDLFGQASRAFARAGAVQGLGEAHHTPGGERLAVAKPCQNRVIVARGLKRFFDPTAQRVGQRPLRMVSREFGDCGMTVSAGRTDEIGPLDIASRQRVAAAGGDRMRIVPFAGVDRGEDPFEKTAFRRSDAVRDRLRMPAPEIEDRGERSRQEGQRGATIHHGAIPGGSRTNPNHHRGDLKETSTRAKRLRRLACRCRRAPIVSRSADA
jgi:hypothetical protein